MFNERAFIARVESAGPEELASILMRPSLEEERALRAHLGDQRYQRMHSMALKRSVSRSVVSKPKGKVVVIHGIMGAELSVSNGGAGDLTWVNVFRIVRGWLERLRLSEDGRSEFNPKFRVTASGIMKRYYGELILSLAENWNVHAFWYDWRKDLDLAAGELNVQITNWFGEDAPVHIVAHSMGGLVARTFIKKYASRWNSMWDGQSNGATGGRLVMLGTPNHGSFAIPQVITGIEGLVGKLALIDLRHNRQTLLEVLNSFVGSYQMLPSPLVMPTMEALYNSGTYGGYNVPQRHLDNARQHHEFLHDVIDENRMIYIAGYDQPTFNDIHNWESLNSIDSYGVTMDGDGRVPHELGLFKRDGEVVIPTYYIKEEHGNLSSNMKILGALNELLETGKTDDMETDLERARVSTRSVSRDPEELKNQYLKALDEDETRIKISLGRLGTRTVGPDEVSYVAEREIDETIKPERFSPEERKMEETITRGFLAYRGEEQSTKEFSDEGDQGINFAQIEIGLVYGGIESIPYESILSTDRDPVDTISVGHYIGVRPVAAEKALDEAISTALIGKGAGKNFIPAEVDLILTQYTERGIIRGNLGQPFFLSDPRPAKGRNGAATNRIITLAGMGEPGRFGAPELTVLARELCWALGRMQKRHLATVLIGAGMGNLKTREAVSAWMDGIQRAITGSRADQKRHLRRVTFVENNPSRLTRLDSLLSEEVKRRKNTGLKIEYSKPSAQERNRAKQDEFDQAQEDWKKRWKELEEKWEKEEKGAGVDQADREAKGPAPTRVTLGLDAARKTYRFGAITDTASVPEREITIDPTVVMQANDELAGEQNPKLQQERGRFLEQLLIPDDLRRELYNNAPLVIMLDTTTARIHWEMVAQPELITSPATGGAPDGDGRQFDPHSFLGTSRGFTRQLRTTFAPPPEPPPPPRRVLRVLVVADPAEDAHLPGAQEEGVAVADLFDSYNVVYKDRLQDTRIKVTRLFGPLEATRTNVLRELLIRQYDVLHFAGHCVYQWGGDPTLSGWIFNAKKKELLSANELNRIDRIPKFVFSNACESGITPDRSQERSVDLAPSFAEAFFARGVANFVCTAWPVDDLAARQFALTLYSGLLGLKEPIIGHRPARREEGAITMHEAMREARVTIASTSNGRTTWGAYQHYGNPYFQFFYAPGQDARQAEASKSLKSSSGRAERAQNRRAVKRKK